MKKRNLPTDYQLYEQLKQGHPRSLEYIHTRYQRLLFWLGRRQLKDDFAVNTLVQDAFLKLWHYRESIESPNHILGFLRFVLKRDCITYYNTPKNTFYSRLNSLESYENYQDYLTVYDPLQDEEQLLSQQSDQKKYDDMQQVLPVLHPRRKQLVCLCLEYGFQYKPIAAAMGSSVTAISNEVQKAITDLRHMLMVSVPEPQQKKRYDTEPEAPSSRQLEIITMRYEQNTSFAVIAKNLKLPEKEVHREFLAAYQYLQRENKMAKIQ